jgi:hypothetical protein
MNDQPTYADLAAMRDRALAAEKEAAELREQLTNLKEWSATLADVADDLRAELEDERALADRLAGALRDYLNGHLVEAALAACKEARK